jgi:hypothetical protein
MGCFSFATTFRWWLVGPAALASRLQPGFSMGGFSRTRMAEASDREAPLKRAEIG